MEVPMGLPMELVESLINNKYFSIAVVSQSGEYIFVNERWLNAHRLTREHVLGHRPEEFHSNSLFPGVLRTRKPVLGHEVILFPDMVVACCNYYPLTWNDGTPAGAAVLGFAHTTEHAQQTELLLKSLSSQLDHTREQLRKSQVQHYTISDILGESRAVDRLREEIRAAARTNSSVLIEGETGTGKELVARSIHNLSHRSSGRFVAVNCSAIPKELIESELFGYDAGAFTGARKEGKPGKFELANSGTLFLDEINSMDITMQPKLLRALQEHEIEHVGGLNTIPISARLITASNVSLEQMMQEGRFRTDLYYRINVVRIEVPPLRQRKEDIPALVYHTIERLNYFLDMNIQAVDPTVFELLQEYSWPGNIRELQNVIESAMNQCDGDTLYPRHIGPLRENGRARRPAGEPELCSPMLDRQEILNAIRQCNGNKSKAAKRLGISRATLYNKLKGFQFPEK